MPAYAGTNVGSSGSVSATGGSNVSSGVSHMGTPVIRLGLIRDAGSYHNGTYASKQKVAENFSYRYPNIEKELFFVPYEVRSYYDKYGVLIYNSSKRASDKYDNSNSPYYKSVFIMKDDPSYPDNKAKQLIKDYTFLDVNSPKYIGKLSGGKWKSVVSSISRQDALTFWSYVFKDETGIETRMNGVISASAKDYGKNLSDNQKNDIAKGFLGALIMAWVLVPSENRSYWENAIEDYIAQRDLKNKPVSLVFDTCITLFFDGSATRYIMPSIDFIQHYTAISANWDLTNMTRDKFGGTFDTYEMLKRVATKDIQSYPKTFRISNQYIKGNAFANAAQVIVYPNYRLSTKPGYGTFFYKESPGYMDMFTLGKTPNNYVIRGFMLESFSGLGLSGCVSGCGNPPGGGDSDPSTYLSLPLSLHVYPKDKVVSPKSEVIGEKVKLVFKSRLQGALLNSFLENAKDLKSKNPTFKLTITIGSRTGAINPAKYEGSIGSINKEFTLTYDQLIAVAKGQMSLVFYDDTTNEPISPNTTKRIDYSNVSSTLKYVNEDGNQSKTDSTNSDYASFKRPPLPPEPITYTSKPRTYAEFKEGSPDNERFEAMAGVPSTKRLYLGVGGSEFIVDVEFEYMQNVNSVWRTYRSWFSGTDSEFKAGDTWGGVTVPAPSGASSSSLSVTHFGGTVTATWTGTRKWTGSVSYGDHWTNVKNSWDDSEYNQAKSQAQAWVSTLNSFTVSHTSASDKKTRTFNAWGASITTDSKWDGTAGWADPGNAEVKGTCGEPPNTYTCTKVPYKAATGADGTDGGYTITVTARIPAHEICGPECLYTLPAVEDTWKQRVNFDYMKIVRAEVYKLEEGRIVGVEDVFGEGNNELKAVIKSATAPNIFYNIAQKNANGDDVSAQSSKHGRIRYSLETNQHDTVVWYEGVRSNKSAGEGKNGNSNSPEGGGHNNSWAKGILYTNPNYTTEKNYHRQKVAINTATSNQADSVDVQTPEWKKFDERRKSKVVATIISDMLILQTSSGDQSVFYFEKSTPEVEAQDQFPAVRATKEEMWDNNPLSSDKWTEDHIYSGSYNGHFGDSGYGSSNNKKYWGYDFENDKFINNASGGNTSPIETAFDRYGTGVGVDGNTPRPQRPTKLYVWGNRDIEKTTMNGEYKNDGAEVFYREVLNWRSPNAYSRYGNFPLQPSAYIASNQSNFGNKKGLVFEGLYSDDHTKVNDIIIHTPVSTEKAIVVSLPKKRDQRVDLPEGTADNLIDEENKLKVCPLDPAKCEFRVLNCKYRHDITLAEFDFENTTAVTILNKTTGAYVPFEMSSGMGFVTSPITGFGQGKVLRATGTRFSMALSDLGIKVDRYERILVEADLYIPSLNADMMVFSFYKYDFYLPKTLNGQATLNTGNGVERQILNENFVNRRVRLGVEFSLGHIDDSKVYVDGVEVTNYKRVYKSTNSGQVLDLIGDKFNIGSWGRSDLYPANFYIDNLKIVKKGGLYSHTNSCYIWTEKHETVWNHEHNASCYPNGDMTKPPICNNLPLNTMTEANKHVHDASCIYPNGTYTTGGSSVAVGTQYKFGYKGYLEEFVAPETGVYKIQTWGAQGGSGGDSTERIGGYGGYAEGKLTLNKGDKIYVAVGGQGESYGIGPQGSWTYLRGGFNGGGMVYTYGGGGSGGGATDIRTLGSETVIYNWDFRNSNTHGFSALYYSSLVPTSSGLRVDIGGSDSSFQTPSLNHSLQDSYDYYIRLRVKNNSSGSYAQIYYTTYLSSYTEGHHVAFHMTTNDTEVKEYLIPISTNFFRYGYTLSRLRFDLGNGTSSGNVLVESIQLLRISYNKKIVAGGGGGGAWFSNGAHAGGLNGLNGTSTTGGTQTSGGSRDSSYSQVMTTTNGFFGLGGFGSGSLGGGAGGGGGYYGGGGSGYAYGAAGGSSYIGGVQDGVTYAGNESMPSITGGTQSQGKIGHGYAIITLESATSSDGLDGYSYQEIFGSNWQNYVKEGSSGTQVGKTYDYNYTGGYQQFVAPEKGVYTFELWGAQGGLVPGSTNTGGLGGYVKGDIELNKGQVVYLYVGGKGGDAPSSSIDGWLGLNNNGGWNGGGSGAGSRGAGGGGATDIRIGGQSTSNRVMVAGGGGGGFYPSGVDSYGAGGNTTNLVGSANGENGCVQWFGSYESDTAGGGGGYYGGASICGDDPSSAYGGSSYADSTKVTNTTFTSGVNTGNGKLKITVKEVKGYEVDWDKVKQDADKGIFPEYMWDGNINPLFKYCTPYFGDKGNLGVTKGGLMSNVSVQKMKYPTNNKDVDVLKFNANTTASVTSTSFPFGKYANYKLTMDIWGTEEGRELTVSVVEDSTLVKTFVVTTSVQRVTFNFRTLNDLTNARIKISANNDNGEVYVTNVRVFGQQVYNVHEHTKNCRVEKTLSCTEPHHFGAHYSADNRICWDACGIDANHQVQKKSVTKPDGSTVEAGTFVNLDYGFQLYFPNLGDFEQVPTMLGIPELTGLRGKGYVNNMDTTEYTLEKRVRFKFNVLYNGKMYTAGSWISLPVNQDYYDFYCSLANYEAMGTTVEFEVVPINARPLDDPANENYITVNNKERYDDYTALHGGYKKVYVDVVGRVGNLVASDTEDLRFSNFFKTPLAANQWIVDGVLKKVDMYKQNRYYGDMVDIRGIPSKDTGVWLNTYGALGWLNKAPYAFPINANDQSIDILKEKFLKIGYDIFADIQSIGNYQEGVVRVLPYYFKLDLDSGQITPLDAYVKVGGVYQPVNLYRGADNGTLPSNLYKYDIVMDWEEESYRRNFTMDESVITDKVAEALGEPVYGLVTDSDGSSEDGITGYKRLTTPLGRYVKQGYPQRMVIDKKSRTFIGSSMTYGNDKNPDDEINEIEFQKNAQRWYMKFSLPPATEFVPAGLQPTQSSFDQVKQGNGVILMTADIVVLGDIYNLRYTQEGVDTLTITKGGVTRTFNVRTANLPPMIAILDIEGNASIDISVKKSH